MERAKEFIGRMFGADDDEAGKHKIIFITKEEQEIPSTVTLPEPEKPAGLILDDGSINWNCPCLGSMVAGPCGVQFRTAFSCFHHSEAEPKGSDCIDAFNKMHECMQKYPTIYGPDEKDEEEDVFGVEQVENNGELSKNVEPRNSKSVGDGGDMNPKSVSDRGDSEQQSVAQISNEEPPKSKNQDQKVKIKNSST
ncbi:mitochondrial intermembrane space import and assembly protein 40-B isoform X1 [Rhodnius prolixus]